MQFSFYREGILGRQQLHVNFLKLRKCTVLSYLDALPATGTGSERSPKAVHVTSQTSHPDSLKSCSKISPFFRHLQHCAHPCQQGAAFWHLLYFALLCHFTAFCAPLHSSLSSSLSEKCGHLPNTSSHLNGSQGIRPQNSKLFRQRDSPLNATPTVTELCISHRMRHSYGERCCICWEPTVFGLDYAQEQNVT